MVLKPIFPACFPAIPANQKWYLPASDWQSTPDLGNQQWVGQGYMENKQGSGGCVWGLGLGTTGL